VIERPAQVRTTVSTRADRFVSLGRVNGEGVRRDCDFARSIRASFCARTANRAVRTRVHSREGGVRFRARSLDARLSFLRTHDESHEARREFRANHALSTLARNR